MTDPVQNHSNAVDESPAPAHDRLEGADAIAAYLEVKPRWVYQAREAGWDVPIRKRPGLGLYAFKSELDAWMRAPETMPAKKSA